MEGQALMHYQNQNEDHSQGHRQDDKDQSLPLLHRAHTAQAPLKELLGKDDSARAGFQDGGLDNVLWKENMRKMHRGKRRQQKMKIRVCPT